MADLTKFATRDAAEILAGLRASERAEAHLRQLRHSINLNFDGATIVAQLADIRGCLAEIEAAMRVNDPATWPARSRDQCAREAAA